MRLHATGLSRLMIVIAIAAVGLAMIAVQRASWEIAVFALSVALLACVFLPGRRQQIGEWNEEFGASTTPARKFARVRFTVRTAMIAVACLAIVLWPLHYWRRMPVYEERFSFHAFMAELCEYEAEIMKSRAEACAARASRGAPRDDASEEAEVLKCCP